MSHDPGKWKNKNDDPDGCSVIIGLIIILIIIGLIND
jgi:hypothetical protein